MVVVLVVLLLDFRVPKMLNIMMDYIYGSQFDIIRYEFESPALPILHPYSDYTPLLLSLIRHLSTSPLDSQAKHSCPPSTLK